MKEAGLSDNKSTLHVAAIQLDASGSVEENLQKALSLLDEAVHRGAELAVLPENFLGLKATQQIDFSKDRKAVDCVIQSLANWAASRHVYLCAGTLSWMPPAAKQEKPYAASMMFSPQGEIIGQYHKTHLFDALLSDGSAYRESDYYLPGTEVKVFDIPPVKIGLSVCFDIRFPELYKIMRQAGADVFIVPAAFAYSTGKKHWKTLLQARAIEQQCYVIAASQTTKATGVNALWAHSMIIDPDGKVLDELDREEGVVSAVIDINEIQKVRDQIPLAPIF